MDAINRWFTRPPAEVAGTAGTRTFELLCYKSPECLLLGNRGYLFELRDIHQRGR